MPRSHFPSIAIAVSRPSSRPAPARSRSQFPVSVSSSRASRSWTRVRIRFSLGAVITPAQRRRVPAEPGQHLLRQVRRMVADLPEARRPRQHARDRHCEHEHHGEPAAPPAARIADLRQDLQEAGDLILRLFICAGHGDSTGMRNWHRRPFGPGRSGVRYRDHPGREAVPADRPPRSSAGHPFTFQAGRPSTNDSTRLHITNSPTPCPGW
jgi:hypothetical protein